MTQNPGHGEQWQQQRKMIMTLINDEQLNEKLESSPAPRVTKEYMESRIVNREFFKIGETVTMCHLTLDNGYSVRGESACVRPENYNKEIGERIAYDNAFDELWPLFGFLLAESKMPAGNGFRQAA